ncbi:hypothetical protein NLI96_g5619 [Meripilus lineatus]|uniref:G domain-containing protein n=1 Tax=Meripilus lineatus TaxID=2056292 RepID=A0AAD5YEN6_9APHY|nr:hypothetical protein NLI96_g5619 [Physisporinus lineatus]
MASEQSCEKPILVAVMGPTGSGKSSFINLASDGSLPVSDELVSCTSEIVLSNVFEIDGRRIVIIDTPGFDDTSKPDSEILSMIASYLNESYKAGMTLSGLLFMHRISDTRMGGISRRNFRMFRKLCGDETLKNVLVVTTMWDSVTLQLGNARETQLKSDDRFFKPVLDQGGAMVRHDNTREGAQAILRRILNNHPAPVRLQREMVDEGKKITEIGAADELKREMAELVERHTREIAQIKKEMEEALKDRDEASHRELEEVKNQLENELKRHEQDRNMLSDAYAAEKKKTEETMARYMEEMKQERISREEANRRLGTLQQALLKSRDEAHEKECLLLKQQIAELQRPPPKRGICCIQ